MTQEEKDQIEDYKQRQKEWRDISVTQLSNTNNILLALSSGLLAFYFNKSEITHIHIGCAETINKSDLTYALAIFLLSLSMIYGIAVLFSRLCDFRISRHLALSRQRFYINYKKKLPALDFGDFNFCDRMGALRHVLFCKLSLISAKEIKYMQDERTIKRKFSRLKRTSDILGNASWIWTKFQVLYLLLSCFVYLLHLQFMQ